MSVINQIPYTSVSGASGDYSTVAEPENTNDLADMNVFLELLMTQLQYQDPLSPMENQEFISQIAQLTTVEQLRNANSNLEIIQLYEMSINNAQSVSMIGKTIKAQGDVTELDDSGEAEVSFRLREAAAKAHVTIFDENGHAARTIDLTALEEGEHTITWDGTNDDASPLGEGEYTFTVTAEDENGNSIEVDTFISGVVSGVSFEDGVPMLHVGNHKVTIGMIYEVRQE